MSARCAPPRPARIAWGTHNVARGASIARADIRCAHSAPHALTYSHSQSPRYETRRRATRRSHNASTMRVPERRQGCCATKTPPAHRWPCVRTRLHPSQPQTMVRCGGRYSHKLKPCTRLLGQQRAPPASHSAHLLRPHARTGNATASRRQSSRTRSHLHPLPLMRTPPPPSRSALTGVAARETNPLHPIPTPNA